MSVVAWIAGIYLAAGLLTLLAVELIVRWTEGGSLPKRPGGRRRLLRSRLMTVALWPGVVMMAALFAILTFAQRRQYPARKR